MSYFIYAGVHCCSRLFHHWQDRYSAREYLQFQGHDVNADRQVVDTLDMQIDMTDKLVDLIPLVAYF